MPTDQPSPPHRGRGHHRGRRGPDRRGIDRRQQAPQPQRSENNVDVEQIMREIRSRIAAQHGIDLSEQQIHELAARRLESILDVRTVNPSLVEQMRRSAGSGRSPGASASPEPPYQFEAETIYESSRGLMRAIRRLLNPLLKLFFNPNPLIQALNTQARLNVEAAKREAEREQRQAEWNALHYEILQRLVTEVARVSIEGQELGLRVESLAAKVDFNERRVRGVEGVLHQSASPSVTSPAAVTPPRPSEEHVTPAQASSGDVSTTDAPRRRRRRRRGRRGSMHGGVVPPGSSPQPGTQEPTDLEAADAEGDFEGPDEGDERAETEVFLAPDAAEATEAKYDEAQPSAATAETPEPRTSGSEPEQQ